MRLAILFFVVLSCSRVNVESQDYHQKKFLKHTVIKVSQNAKKMPQREGVTRPEQIALGEELYQKRCATCHGIDATGAVDGSPDSIGNPVNLRQLVREVPQFTLAIQYSKENSTMPGWAQNLTDDDVLAIVEYLKTLK